MALMQLEETLQTW